MDVTSRTVLVALSMALTLATCGREAERSAKPARRLLIATGPPGGVYHPLGQALARIYNQRIPEVHAEARSTAGSVFNVDAVQKGDIDLAFSQGDAAYSAHLQEAVPGPAAGGSLRGVGVLYVDVLQIMVRRDGPIRSVRGLVGRRVGIGPHGSKTEAVAAMVMDAHGLPSDGVHQQFLDFDEAARRLAAGNLDAAFMMAGYPADGVILANQGAGVRLLSVDREAMSGIRERHPFYRPILIPQGTYAGQSSDVHTLGVDNVLVCRADLDEDLVYRLTEVLITSVPELVQVHVSARGIDPEQAPATPILLHAGAARFYRTREIVR